MRCHEQRPSSASRAMSCVRFSPQLIKYAECVLLAATPCSAAPSFEDLRLSCKRCPHPPPATIPSSGAPRRRLQTDRARPLAPPQPYTTRRLYINSLMGWPSVDTSHHLPPCRRRVRGGVWCGGGVRCVVVALTDSLYTHHCVAHGTTRGRSRQIRALGLHSLTTQPTGMACACEWPWSGCGAGRSVGHMSLGVCLDMLRISPPTTLATATQ